MQEQHAGGAPLTGGGGAAARSRKPLPPTVLLVALLLVILLHVLPPRLVLIPDPANLAGLLPLAAGVWLNLAADALLKHHRTTVKPFQPSAALVTEGPYARTRHPMYLGFALILLGIAALLGSAWPFLVVAVFPALMEMLYIRAEESMLRDRFGEEWVLYRARVRRWL